MTTKPSPVPSKNALRALRHLAYSSPTVFVGAVGSICGLALLNHEARQRIKLAEEIVRTKRTIQSVSNGRGQAHIARMCEAAERGEDFTLRTDAESKRRRARHRSTVPLDERILGEEDIITLQQSLQRLSHQRRSKPQDPEWSTTESSTRPQEIEKGLSTAQPTHTPRRAPVEYWQPSNHGVKKYSFRNDALNTVASTHTPRRFQPSRRNTVSAERIRAATLVPVRRESHQVYARQNRQYVTESRRRVSSVTSPRLSPAQASAEHDEIKDDFPDIFTDPEHFPEPFTTPSEFSHRLTPDPRYVDRRRRAGDEADPPGHSHEFEVPEEDSQDRDFDSTLQHLFADATSHDDPYSDLRSSEDQLREGILPEAALDTDVSHRPPEASSTEPDMTNIVGDEAFQNWPISPVSDEAGVRDAGLNEDVLAFDADTEQVLDGNYRQFFASQHRDIYHSLGTSKQTLGIEHLQASNGKSDNDQAASVPFMPKLINPIPMWRVLQTAHKRLYMFLAASEPESTSLSAQAEERIQALARKLNLEEAEVMLEAIANDTNPFKAHNAITRCLDTKTSTGNTMAEILYYTFFFRGRFWLINLPCKRLALELLKNEDTAARAGFVLFPPMLDDSDPMETGPAIQTSHRRAAQYLSWFCNNNADPVAWVVECRKVVKVTRMRGEVLHDKIIAPVLRHLVQVGQRRWAQQFLYEMQNTGNLKSTFVSYNIILAGHAAAGDWMAVTRMLEEVHTPGLSRYRATGFSLLFGKVFEEFIRQKSLDEAYDYMMYATGNLGLIPTSTVSMTLVTACLQQSRYDLIQDWIEYMEQHHPRVESGTATDYSAW